MTGLCRRTPSPHAVDRASSEPTILGGEQRGHEELALPASSESWLRNWSALPSRPLLSSWQETRRFCDALRYGCGRREKRLLTRWRTAADFYEEELRST